MSTISNNYVPNTLEWMLGLKVSIKTLLGDIFTGDIYAYCPITNTVTIRYNYSDNEKNTIADYRVLRIPFVKEISILDDSKSSIHGISNDGNNNNSNINSTISSNTSNSYNTFKPLPMPVSLAEVEKHKNESLAKSEKHIKSRGVGVSAEAQFVYDALAKTLPVRWNDKSIIVLEEIIIKEPYTVEAVSSLKGKEAAPALSRVKKVLAGERQKINNIKPSKNTNTNTNNNTNNNNNNTITNSNSNSNSNKNSANTSSNLNKTNPTTSPFTKLPPEEERKGG